MCGSIYVPRGVNVKSLSVDCTWPFVPLSNWKVMIYTNKILIASSDFIEENFIN